MGAAKGTLRADQTNFRKKGTGNPVLIPKKEGKFLNSPVTTSSISEIINWEQFMYLSRSQCKLLRSEEVLRTFFLSF